MKMKTRICGDYRSREVGRLSEVDRSMDCEGTRESSPPRTRLGGRQGLTLVELLVAMVVASVVMAAIFMVLVQSQRTYGVQSERIAGQQTVRAGIDVLAAELRGISASGGDILSMDDDEVEIRAPRGVAITCQVLGTNPLEVRAVLRGGTLEQGTEVFIFADGDPDTAADDIWLSGTVASASAENTAGDCPDNPDLELIRLTFNNVSPSAGAAGVRRGAPVRGYEVLTYGIVTDGGEPFLGWSTPGGDDVPLVGPLASSDGFSLQFLDASGAETSTATEVRAIRATLRTASNLSDAVGRPVADSLSILVNTRN